MKLQEEITRILEVMGVLSEQSISLPKIISGSFTSYDADSAHKFNNLEKELEVVLTDAYNSGYNPKITNISVSIKKNNNTFTTTYRLTVDNSNDGRSWMGFTTRGSIGSDYENRADGQINGQGDKNGKSLVEKLKSIGAGEIEYIAGTPIIDRTVPFKQYFVQFTKPNKYPPHATNQNKSQQSNPQVAQVKNIPQSTQENKETVISDNNFESFISKISNQTENTSVDSKSVQLTIDTKSDNYKLSFKPGSTKVKKLVLAINITNDKKRGSFPSKEKYMKDYPDSSVIYQGTFDGNTRDFALIGIKW